LVKVGESVVVFKGNIGICHMLANWTYPIFLLQGKVIHAVVLCFL
jgi:hypothetical protein